MLAVNRIELVATWIRSPSSKPSTRQKSARLAGLPEMHQTRKDNEYKQSFLLHMPAVTDDDGLACQSSGRESSQMHRKLRYIFQGSELAVHRVLEHNFADHFVF